MNRVALHFGGIYYNYIGFSFLSDLSQFQACLNCTKSTLISVILCKYSNLNMHYFNFERILCES